MTTVTIPDEAGYWLDEYDADRFWCRVNFHGGTGHLNDPLSTAKGECWKWTGSGGSSGTYGTLDVYGRIEMAHRISYRDFGRKIPPGYEIDHLCRVVNCVRPSHLEAVTHAVNMERSSAPTANRTHCRNGHELTPESITVRKDRERLVRRCLACYQIANARHQAKKRAQNS